MEINICLQETDIDDKKERLPWSKMATKSRLWQLQIHNVPIDDVENANGTN